jgi:hypothetical protein
LAPSGAATQACSARGGAPSGRRTGAAPARVCAVPPPRQQRVDRHGAVSASRHRLKDLVDRRWCDGGASAAVSRRPVGV